MEFLVGNIASILEKEIASLGGVRGGIRELKLELESTRSFLRDADKCKEQNEGVKVWVAQVRDVAYKAEDIIDEFTYRMDFLKRGGGGVLKGFFNRVVRIPREILVKHQTAGMLKEIKDEIQSVADRSKRYDLRRIDEGSSSHGSSTWVQNLGESSYFLDDDHVVGMKKEKESLLGWLMDGESQRTVISVVGMGGSGKTTLVAKAFNNLSVKRFFACQAWVTVTQNFMIEDLFKRLIKELCDGNKELVPSGLSAMGYKQLVETLVEFLQEKRYVIVLDDVWTDDLWRQINIALPDGRHGSRIIITTRKGAIASYPFGVKSHVLHAQPLNGSDAWTLFCKKAFPNEITISCPPQLEELACAFIEKCEGLPLAIVALGGLLASKDKSELKWRAVYDSLRWHLSHNSTLEVVKTILFLSFNDLPYYLKYCFLYCCRFPGDDWIGKGRLIRLWIAEGFVEGRRDITLEEVGKSYLKELTTRNLIQVFQKSNYLRNKVCKLHDLMRELAIITSETDNFCSIYDSEGVKNERTRRLSILKVDATFNLSGDMPQLRSFMAFNFDKSANFQFDALLCSFRLLRVLELEDSRIDNVPTVLGSLFNLRYLNFKGTKIMQLPKSLRRLGNLQTLDIRKTKVKALPDGLDKLHNLRHLLTHSIVENEAFNYVTGTQVPPNVKMLKNLQTVNCIEANGEIVRGLGNLTQLKRLDLTKVREADEKALCASIEKLKCLRHLLVMVTNEDELLRMDALSSISPLLRNLTLIGKLNTIPRWFLSLIRNVVHLHLHWSRLTEDDPIPYACALPNLERFVLVNAYDLNKKDLCFNEGFPKLQHLSLVVFPQLVEIKIVKGVMPGLIWLKLHVCPKLKKVPEGIEHLESLEQLNLKDVTDELIQSIRGEESLDHPRVRHIPKIYHSKQIGSAYKYESLS